MISVRPFPRRALSLGLALSLTGAMLAAVDATAASYATRAHGCKGNVCLNASFSASTLKISSSYNGGNRITHFNYRSDCFGGQRDVDRGRVMSIGVPEGRKSCACLRSGVPAAESASARSAGIGRHGTFQHLKRTPRWLQSVRTASACACALMAILRN